MKINYQFIPAFMICLFAIFFTTPNPMFLFYGINWIMVSLAVLWGIIIIFPLFKKFKSYVHNKKRERKIKLL